MASRFDILPAIDLRGDRVVRLRQGDFDRETSFSDDPVAVARSFADGGATWLHVVDLDGARAGEPVHADIVTAIVAAVGERVSVEVAGGLRSEAAVDAMLAVGAARAVVGTAALRDPAFAGRLVSSYGPERIASAIDVRDGSAVGEAWSTGSTGTSRGAEDAVRLLADQGVTTFEVTAIERDGSLEGPNLDLLGRLVALDRGTIVASGGIGTLGDVQAVRSLGCGGVIVGRALYEGRFSTEEVIALGR